MNIASVFILRPVMTTLVMAAFVIFGVISYFQLPVSDLPSVDFPSIMVNATLPGANADTMASAVATPLERQFSNIAGLESMNSTSSPGSTLVTLQFDMSRKIDGAAEDVQSAIVAAQPYLPTSMPTPPTFRKANPADAPILYIALSSQTLPLYSVDDYAEQLMAQGISMVNGVAQVQVFGSQIYAVHAQVDPDMLSARGIGIDEVVSAIRNNNVNLPTGTLYGPYKAWNVFSNGQLFNANAYRPLIVAYRHGAPVRLGELGQVIDSVQNDKVASWYTNTRAIILAVQRQPNTNTIQVVDRILKMLPTYRAVMPRAIDMNILYDRSQSIRASVNDVQLTLLVTLGLVILVIFMFLGDIRATLIASLALPVSILGTLAIINLLHFSLNNLSLMALTLCVGFVVDDAIVMLENIVRHVEKGETPINAALKGSKEISFTIMSMTISLVAVFIPILFLPGLIGRIFNEFAVTISIAILLSGLTSLSLTAMLCSRFLKVAQPGEGFHFRDFVDTSFKKGLEFYAVTLDFALHHRLLVFLSFIAMVVATVFVFRDMPKGFLPSEDIGQIFGMTEGPQGISFDDMVIHQKQLADIVYKDPNVKAFMSSVGSGGPNLSGNSGRIFIVLKPKKERTLRVDGIIQELRDKTSHVPGIKLYLQNLGSIRVGGQLTKAQYQLTLSSANIDHLYSSSIELEGKMKEMPDLLDVNSDLQIKNLQVNVNIDREKCSQLGVSMQQVEDALNSAYSARQVSTIYTPDNQYWVICEVEPKYYRSPELMHKLYIRSATNGTLIPLSTVARTDMGVGPLLINHLGQFPSVTLSFNLKPGVALSQAVDEINKITPGILPDDVTPSFQGTAQIFETSVVAMPLLLLIAILVIYIVLGILYESFIHPVTILSGLPSAGLGALIILMLFHVELSIYSFLGLILLIGIVKKNAIMIIDFALDAERNERKSSEEAIYEACLVRFRPIMMTTLAALMGSIPIATGIGSGSESRQPLGLTVVGGLLASQIVTLYITPVFYLYLDRFQKFVQKIIRWFAPSYEPGETTGDSNL
jgi:HAE1 family hydrophobic/amphiphilic exporter-1